MASTITNVSSNINIAYPLPGVDNDSQGFRSNFTSIKNSLQVASDEISRLQSSTNNPDLSDSDYIEISSNALFFGTTNQDQYDSGYNLAVGAFILAQDTTPTFFGMGSADQDIAIVAKADGVVRVGPIEGLTEIHHNNIKTSLAGSVFEVQAGTITGAMYEANAFKIAFGRFEFGTSNLELYYGLGSPTEDIAIVAQPNGTVRLGPFDALIEVAPTFVRPSLNNTKSLGTADFRWTSVFATNGTIQTSDSRLKTDIADLTLGLDFVNNLRPVSFKRTDDADQLTHWGLVAQEVKQTIDAHGVAFAGWTESQDEHKTQMLNYSEFVSPLIKAVQELSIENQELRSQLNAIKLHLGL